MVIRQLLTGAFNGLAIGVISGSIAAMFTGDPKIGLVVGLAALANLLAANLAGAGIPIVLERLGKDPARREHPHDHCYGSRGIRRILGDRDAAAVEEVSRYPLPRSPSRVACLVAAARHLPPAACYVPHATCCRVTGTAIGVPASHRQPMKGRP